MSDITYSWNEYIRLNEELVYKVAKSGWQFDCLICLSRGGMRPAISSAVSTASLSRFSQRARTAKPRALCKAISTSLNA